MLRKTFISLVATAALGAGMIAMTSAADAHRRDRHDDGLPLSFFLGFPGYGFYSPRHYDGDYYRGCGFRRVPIKKWNKSHTHRIKVYKKRWVCY